MKMIDLIVDTASLWLEEVDPFLQRLAPACLASLRSGLTQDPHTTYDMHAYTSSSSSRTGSLKLRVTFS